MLNPVAYNAEKLYSKTINIYTESSPNPNSMKFVLSAMLSGDDDFVRDYDSITMAAESPLASEIVTCEKSWFSSTAVPPIIFLSLFNSCNSLFVRNKPIP